MWSVDLPLADRLADGLLETDRPIEIIEADEFDGLDVPLSTFFSL